MECEVLKRLIIDTIGFGREKSFKTLNAIQCQNQNYLWKLIKKKHEN